MSLLQCTNHSNLVVNEAQECSSTMLQYEDLSLALTMSKTHTTETTLRCAFLWYWILHRHEQSRCTPPIRIFPCTAAISTGSPRTVRVGPPMRIQICQSKYSTHKLQRMKYTCNAYLHVSNAHWNRINSWSTWRFLLCSNLLNLTSSWKVVRSCDNSMIWYKWANNEALYYSYHQQVAPFS